MAEVLPPKRQAVVDRLRRRIESYRRHQNDCIPRFDQSFNGVVEQNIQDTLVLKQRFLESKAKRAAKKSDKKPSESTLQNNVHTLPKFTAKRSSSEEVEGGSENYSGEPPAKQPAQENLTKFSVEIVQQLEFTTTATNSQISTNVTVKALNTSVKSDQSGSPRPPSPRKSEVVECKREPENPEFVDLEECAAALEKDAANGGSSFPGFSDLIGDDTSDAIITSDAFKDLISEISDFNPEFMKDFDFDGGDSKPSADLQPPPQFKVEEDGKRGRRTGGYLGELSPAAHTLKQMAEQHQHKTQMGIGFRPGPKSPYDFQFNGTNDFVNGPTTNQQGFKRGVSPPPCGFSTDNVKQEVFSGGRNSPVNYGEIPSPRLVKRQYPSYGSPQYGGRQQQPPRPSSGPSLQGNQAHISQPQIQVSMGQKMSAELGVYNQDNSGFCSVSQSQTINFTQQSLRQRAPPRQAQLPVVQGRGVQDQIGVRPAPPEYNKGQSMLHAMMAQRFPSQSRMLPLQPMPPSDRNHLLTGPMMRAQQPQYITTGPVSAQTRMPTYTARARQPNPIPDAEWRQMLMQQSRPQFHQAQGVTFGTNNTQISAGQMQHMTRTPQQHQSLSIHHSNPSMSVSLQMNQSMNSGTVFSSSSSRSGVSQLPLYSAPSYTNATVSSSYPSSNFNQSSPAYQQHQQSTIPSDFSLDFLEQLPTTDSNSFSEQELLSSLESGTSFNLQDIL